MVEKNYTISIKGGGKNREINLSAGTFKFGVASLILGAVIFVGACGYSVYSALFKQMNADSVTEVQRANEIQQEQLLTISKKADEMSEKLQDLTRQEEALRLQAGLKPPKEDPLDAENISAEAVDDEKTDETVDVNKTATETAPAENNSEKHTGQGGPISELKISEVAEALDILEQRISIRKESLDAFQTELQERSANWAKKSPATPAATSGNAGTPSTSSPAGETWILPINGGTGATQTPAVSAPAKNSLPSTAQNIDWSKFTGNPSANSNTPSIWPATGVVTSPYGLRWGGSDFHPGMDIANDLGTPIVATADGTVEYAGWDSGGYGNMVDINHGNGIMTRYGHASQVLVSVGQSVKRGQIIAYMGSTGFSTGPHVHYEVHVNGQKVNPISYL